MPEVQEHPSEVLPECKTPAKRESSELKNMKALIYFGVMIVAFIVFCVLDPVTRRTGYVNGHIFGLELQFAFVAWIVSKMLPAGWITTLRAFYLALVINGSLIISVLYVLDANK